MEAIVRRLIKEEGGQALLLAVILLLVAGLVVASLLSFMGTGLRVNPVYAGRTAELYAADAGVEDAVWKIQHPLEAGYLPCSASDIPRVYNITDINGKFVEVTIEYVGEGDYRITSIAVTADGGNTAAIDSATAVEAYATADTEYVDYSGMMDHIVTVAENLTEQQVNDLQNDLSKLTIACREECADECEDPDPCGTVYDYYDIPDGCYGCGAVYNYPDVIWPTPELLAGWYWEDVEDEEPYPWSAIDLNGIDGEEGPLYRRGTLGILNSGDVPATLTLNGTMYITGNTDIGQTREDFTIDLNGHTIFVAANTTGSPYALSVGGQCTIDGPGAIIAVGDIYFAPKGSVGSNEEPVFIFSISGTAILQPSGDFYGSVAGSFDVEIKSGEHPTLTYPPGGFGNLFINFPSLFEVSQTYSIASWQVTPLSRDQVG